MRPILGTASGLLAAILLSTSASHAGHKDGGKSARDDDDATHADVKQKPKDKKHAEDGKADGKSADRRSADRGSDDGRSAELARRVEALERQVHELATVMKQRMADERGRRDGGHDADDKQARDKPEPRNRDASDHGLGRVRVIKGPDGQLMVPLADLPPDAQKMILAQSRLSGDDRHADEKSGPDAKKDDGGRRDDAKEGDGKKDPAKGRDGDQPRNKKNAKGDDEDEPRTKGKAK